MSPPHPDAVGSYGIDAEDWIRREVGVEFRWWQSLAMRRQLEYDAAGDLVWGQVIESTPRRAGKSVRLRCMALWRVAHAELLGETQLVLHTGKDLPIAKEIHRRAWRWAEGRGWKVKRQNGNEELEAPDESRWIVRGRDSVYGYDVGLGMVDEAWGVDPSCIDEGLEPALLERCNPQLHLTSTAHRRASSLMRRRIAAAVAGLGHDRRTLLLWWAADTTGDYSDPDQWRLASPYWSAARAELIHDKLDRAVRGEADPEADDPDPVEGFKAQYLNLWPTANAGRVEPGEAVFGDTEWSSIAVESVPDSSLPVVAAIEGWFTDGVALARAWHVEGRVCVGVDLFPSLSEAVAAVGVVTWLVVGKSLAEDPQLTDLNPEPVGGTTRQAVAYLRQVANDGLLRHDGSPGLSTQVLGLRVLPSADGPRIRTAGRADAVKAAAWAVEWLRKAPEAPAVF
jgi:hypothetical protein